VSFIPKTVAGSLRVDIVGDITFFIRGDSNRDETVDLTDAVNILNLLFRGASASSCPDAADADDNGAVEITDAIHILHFLFLGTASIPAPFPEPGTDPTLDRVGGCSR
jgi:hypothetical protein